MEISLLLVVLGFLIFIVRHLSGISDDLKQLQKEFDEFRKQKAALPPQLADKTPESKPTAILRPEPVIPKAETILEIKDLPPLRPEVGPGPAQLKNPERAYPQPAPAIKISWFEKWLHDNPDIEKFIGENLINKIGIAVLVLGIAFFVKYAIDQEWINKVGRVSIGLFCGALLVWLANRLRKNYHAFSSVLAGGGITIFYFTIAFAFHQYQLIDQTVAFGSMVVITVFAVLLSILYNRLELGILATIGAFITPFLVSHGDGNWLVLFTYITIVNAGLIILAYYKRWRVINFISFFFTQAIYLGWIISKSGSASFAYGGTFIFGAVFYLMFIVMNVIHHVSRGSKLKAFDFIILLSVNLSFYGAGIYLMEQSGMSMYNGLFTAVLGIINLLLAYLFFRRTRADKNFVYLLIGITLSFISLTAPVQLKGHFITMFWSAEMVVLLWLYQKSFISLLKIAMLLVSGLMLVSLMMDWSSVYGDDRTLYLIIFNKGFITGFLCAIAMYVVYRMLQREADTFFIRGVSNRVLRNVFLTGSIVVFFFAGALEINDQFTKRFPASGLQYIYLQLYITTFAIILFTLVQQFEAKFNKYLPPALSLATFVFYLFNITNIYFAETQALTTQGNRNYFPASWASALLLLLLAFKTIRYISKNQIIFIRYLAPVTWFISIAILTILSVEIKNLFVWLNYYNPGSIPQAEDVFGRAGLTIVWGISSFIMIWVGMSRSYKTLRIIALVVFGITLLKLFMFDIKNIAPAGKIIAFILLGVLLLLISFMYQRLKKIIIDDSTE